jgi:hypothetical protein
MSDWVQAGPRGDINEVALRWPDSFIGCRVNLSTALSIPNNTWKAIVFDGADSYDYDTMHNPASSNTKIFINTAGYYRITAEITFASNVTGGRTAWSAVNMNGAFAGTTGSIFGKSSPAVITGFGTPVALFVEQTPRAVGDYIEIYAFQNSGVALNVTRAVATVTLAKYGFGGRQWNARRDFPDQIRQLDCVRTARTAALTLTTATLTSVPLTAADEFDTAAFHNPASNSSRITIPAGYEGVYTICGHLKFTANTAGERWIYLIDQAGNIIIREINRPVSGDHEMCIVGEYGFTAGQYVEMQARQGSGGNLDLLSAELAAFRNL